MKWLRRLLGVLLATCAVSQAWAQTLPLSYVPIDFPRPSGEIRHVSGPNNAGQIVGSILDGSFHGFIYDHGSFTILDVPFPGALHTEAYGINNRGEVVGTYSTATTYYGFIWRSGVFTRFDVPSAVCCTALSGVNDSGEIIGWYADVNGFRAFLFSGD